MAARRAGEAKAASSFVVRRSRARSPSSDKSSHLHPHPRLGQVGPRCEAMTAWMSEKESAWKTPRHQQSEWAGSIALSDLSHLNRTPILSKGRPMKETSIQLGRARRQEAAKRIQLQIVQ